MIRLMLSDYQKQKKKKEPSNSALIFMHWFIETHIMAVAMTLYVHQLATCQLLAKTQ